MNDTVLKLVDLKAGYTSRYGDVLAVDGVSFDLKGGEFLGIAGESGCGKSTLAYAIMNLLEENGRIFDGEILFRDENIALLKKEDSRKLRWSKISMVFQSAMNALNPVLRIGEQLSDVVLVHKKDFTRKMARERAAELLSLVDISTDRLDAYPHQLSGGMKQRVMIAMALMLEPEVLIMDEPTTALDVVVQRTIIEKITDLQKKFNFSVIFITHDLSLLVEISDTLAIMYSGKIVEYGPSAKVYARSSHPYTRGLMSSFPPLMGELVEFGGIPGKPPDFLSLPKGCRFCPRCPEAFSLCETTEPQGCEIEPGHSAWCHLLSRGEVNV